MAPSGGIPLMEYTWVGWGEVSKKCLIISRGGVSDSLSSVEILVSSSLILHTGRRVWPASLATLVL